jgi:hypothetical protein
MKKSVAVIAIFALLAIILALSNGYNTLTGLQVIDLPEPPPIPGMESEQVQTTPQPSPTPKPTPVPTDEAAGLIEGEIPTGEDMAAVLARLDAIENKLKALDLLPAWEQRLNKVEAQASIAADMSARLDAMQSQIDALRVDVDNLKMLTGRPFVDQPMFFDELGRLSRKNTILSVTLSVVVLGILIAMIAANILQRKKEYLADKKLLRQYLLNYQKQGYRLDMLRMHLKASGWADWFIDEVTRELPK